MINLLPKQNDFEPAISQKELNDQQVLAEIKKLKKQLKDKLLILGHHYQQDDIISFADITGDSLELAKKVSQTNAPYIIFCGVHFMAETADMLTNKDQQVILPDLNAGCSMADMANHHDINQAWEYLTSCSSDKIIPITYINCTANLKSFVGEHAGSICTSSNAKQIIQWGLKQGEKLLFFPDQHLGRNTCFELGIQLDEMVIYDPNLVNGGLTEDDVRKAKIILWYGCCSVHQGFTTEHIKNIKQKDPDINVIVHPECSFDVVQNADYNGSTSFIVKTIQEAKLGSKWAVGTEINLVNRLAQRFSDKEITSLSPYQCLCTTMYRIRPRWLLHSMRSVLKNNPINVIKVDKNITSNAIKALDTMLNII